MTNPALAQAPARWQFYAVYASPRDRRRLANKVYRQARPEQTAARGAAWRTAHPRYGIELKAERRARVDVLKDRPCHDCGQTFPPECMDFDHRDGTTKADNVSRLLHSWPALLAEIAKCDLVCANCHRIRTRRRLHVRTR